MGALPNTVLSNDPEFVLAKAEPELVNALASWPTHLKKRLLELSTSVSPEFRLLFLRVFACGEPSSKLDAYLQSQPHAEKLMLDALDLQSVAILGSAEKLLPELLVGVRSTESPKDIIQSFVALARRLDEQPEIERAEVSKRIGRELQPEDAAKIREVLDCVAG